MKLKLSKRTRLLLTVLLILAVVVWHVWGQDTAPAEEYGPDPAPQETVESLSEEGESQLAGGAATDESNSTGTPPDKTESRTEAAQSTAAQQSSAANDSSAAEADRDEAEPADSAADDETAADSDAAGVPAESYPTDENVTGEADPIDWDEGGYTTKEEVAWYIHTYGCLPDNFMTKAEARDLGWEGGSLEPYAEGMCIGGDRFGNYEGLLPEKEGRWYTECDIDTLGKSSRGAKRIVFSNDGLIYYTDDHYESFTLLYGEEKK